MHRLHLQSLARTLHWSWQGEGEGNPDHNLIHAPHVRHYHLCYSYSRPSFLEDPANYKKVSRLEHGKSTCRRAATGGTTYPTQAERVCSLQPQGSRTDSNISLQKRFDTRLVSCRLQRFVFLVLHNFKPRTTYVPIEIQGTPCCHCVDEQFPATELLWTPWLCTYLSKFNHSFPNSFSHSTVLTHTTRKAEPTQVTYLPVMNDDREGQHTGSVAKALVNVAPWCPKSFTVWGITSSEPSSRSWSSVRMNRMFGFWEPAAEQVNELLQKMGSAPSITDTRKAQTKGNQRAYWTCETLKAQPQKEAGHKERVPCKTLWLNARRHSHSTMNLRDSGRGNSQRSRQKHEEHTH